MAIWQFHLYIIPKKSLINKYGAIPSTLFIDSIELDNNISDGNLDSEPEFEDALTIHWWLDLHLSTDEFFPLIKKFGQKETLIGGGLKTIGNPDTNDLSVCFDKNTDQVQEVSCRIDPLNINPTEAESPQTKHSEVRTCSGWRGYRYR